MLRFFAFCWAAAFAAADITAVGRVLNGNKPMYSGDFYPDTYATPPSNRASSSSVSSLGEIFRDRFVRQPFVVVVDRTSEPLSKTKRMWRSLQASRGDIGVKLALITYSNSGRVAPINITNTDGFIRQLEAAQPSSQEASQAKGAAYYTVLKATEQVPFDGAIVLFTGTEANDESLAQLAAQTLVKKRCKIHVVWCGGPLENLGGVEILYRNIANFTGGNFIVSDFAGEVEDNYESFTTARSRIPQTSSPDSTPGEEVTLVVRRNIVGRYMITIPVDTTVETLNIAILGNVKQAVLQNPKGIPTDLLSQVSVRQMFPTASFSATSDALKVRLITVRDAPGAWPLTTVGGGASERYDVIVTATSRLRVTASINRAEDGISTGNPFKDSSMLRLTALGDIVKVEGVTLLDESGKEVVELNYHESEGPSGAKELYVSTEKLPESPYYLQLTGQDSEGTSFTRVSSLTQQQTPAQLSPVSVDVSTQSTLTVQRGQAARIIFTITNNQPVPITAYFSGQSSTMRIQVIEPQQFVIGPQQSVNVLVIAQTNSNAPDGLTNTLAFFARFGPNTRITRQVIVTTGVGQERDNDKPTLSYTVNTDCKKASEIDCQRTVWSIVATIQDRNSGLLQIISRPQGVLYRSAFIAGTKEPVTVYYSATCCNSKVDLIGVDARGNYVKQTIDIYATDRTLTEGEIAAIVLGVLLLLIIIALVILAVIVCRRRRSASFSHTAH